MVGLLVKDFVTSKKLFLIFAILLLVMFVIGIVQKDFLTFSMLLAVICLLAPYTAIAYDEVSKFDKYAISMPIKKKNIILEKYVYSFIFIFSYFVITLILASANGNFIKDIKMFMAMISATTIIFSIITPVAYKFGLRYGQVIVFAFVFLFSTLMGFVNKKSIFSVDALKIVEIVLPCVAVASFVGSIFLSQYIYKNKSFN